MLSAINSASYKSSFEPEGMPREEETIRKEILEAEQEITKLLTHFKDFYCELDPQLVDTVSMFEELDTLRARLPGLFDTLDELESELCQARYEPEPPEDD